MTRQGDAKRNAEREALGLRLQVLRVHTGLSQKQVAEAIEVRRASLGAWEAGTSEPGALDVPKLADLFKVDVRVILGRAPMPEIKAATQTGAPE